MSSGALRQGQNRLCTIPVVQSIGMLGQMGTALLMNMSHYYRRFHCWLTKRYYSEDWTGAEPMATVRLAVRDPLFWLWAVLPHGQVMSNN